MPKHSQKPYTHLNTLQNLLSHTKNTHKYLTLILTHFKTSSHIPTTPHYIKTPTNTPHSPSKSPPTNSLTNTPFCESTQRGSRIPPVRGRSLIASLKSSLPQLAGGLKARAFLQGKEAAFFSLPLVNMLRKPPLGFPYSSPTKSSGFVHGLFVFVCVYICVWVRDLCTSVSV